MPVPVHPRDRLARATKDDVIFIKQVPVHPRDRLTRATKDEVVLHWLSLRYSMSSSFYNFSFKVPLMPFVIPIVALN